MKNLCGLIGRLCLKDSDTSLTFLERVSQPLWAICCCCPGLTYSLFLPSAALEVDVSCLGHVENKIH